MAIDLTAPHDENGRHPQAKNLVWVECYPYHGIYLVTTPAIEGSVRMSGDDVAIMLGSQNEGEEEDEPPQEGYAPDDYLELFATD